MTSSLEDIMAAVKVVLGDAVWNAELNVYDHVSDVVNSPAVVPLPSTSNFSSAMHMGGDQYEIILYVLIANNDTESAQFDLRPYVTGQGAKSIRQRIFANPTLGLSDVDAMVKKMTDYGGRFEVGPTNYVGAKLHLMVQVN